MANKKKKPNRDLVIRLADVEAEVEKILKKKPNRDLVIRLPLDDEITRTVYCNCKNGCLNRRCGCLKNKKACDQVCGCLACKNPLNGVDRSNLSVCAIQNIKKYKALSEHDLAEEFELPCGCSKVSLTR
jgi:hypothetical protein